MTCTGPITQVVGTLQRSTFPTTSVSFNPVNQFRIDHAKNQTQTSKSKKIKNSRATSKKPQPYFPRVYESHNFEKKLPFSRCSFQLARRPAIEASELSRFCVCKVENSPAPEPPLERRRSLTVGGLWGSAFAFASWEDVEVPEPLLITLLDDAVIKYRFGFGTYSSVVQVGRHLWSQGPGCSGGGAFGAAVSQGVGVLVSVAGLALPVAAVVVVVGHVGDFEEEKVRGCGVLVSGTMG